MMSLRAIAGVFSFTLAKVCFRRFAGLAAVGCQLSTYDDFHLMCTDGCQDLAPLNLHWDDVGGFRCGLHLDAMHDPA
jgi:hypothetical protein